MQMLPINKNSWEFLLPVFVGADTENNKNNKNKNIMVKTQTKP